MSNNADEVICPQCCHQFRATPENVQSENAALREDSDALLQEALVKLTATVDIRQRNDFAINLIRRIDQHLKGRT